MFFVFIPSEIKIQSTVSCLFQIRFFGFDSFIIWDAWFTEMGVWWFRDDYLLGMRFLGLPVEEWLFFICIPFSCVFTYFCITKFFNLKWKSAPELYLTLFLVICFTILASLNYDKIYPFLTFSLTALTMVFLKFIAKSDWIGEATVIYILLLPGFFAVNGVLTGTGLENPIVNYNPDHFMNIRIGTIPLEDSIYGYMLILWNLYFFKKFAKQIKNR